MKNLCTFLTFCIATLIVSVAVGHGQPCTRNPRPASLQMRLKCFEDEAMPPRTWWLDRFITTHYALITDYGGSRKQNGVPLLYWGQDADLRWNDPGNPEPSYNKYNNELTAYTAIRLQCDDKRNNCNDCNTNGVPDEIEAFELVVYRATKGAVHVDILNWSPDENISSYLLENHDNVQIINNWQFGTSLFTVMFPPKWNKSKPLPILLCGNGIGADNNVIYQKKHYEYAAYVGLSSTEWNTEGGLIAIRSNCGGRESAGINTNARDDVGRFLVEVMQGKFGANINKVMTEGASRAGNTALVWGANVDGVTSHDYKYTVVSVHAYVPAVMFGSMFISPRGDRISYTTFPSYISLLNHTFCSEVGYLRDPRDALYIVVGTRDPGEANTRSAWGYYSDPGRIEDLKKKRIYITQGTHDSFLPMHCFLDFDRRLTEKGIPHTTYIEYVRGHTAVECQDDDFRTIIKLVKEEPIPARNGGRNFYMPKKLFYDEVGKRTIREGKLKIDNLQITRMKIHRPHYFGSRGMWDSTKVAFSAAIPHLVAKGSITTIVLIGEPGYSWGIRARKENGYYTVYGKSGVFGDPNAPSYPDVIASGPEYVLLNCSEIAAETGAYEWFFTYNDPLSTRTNPEIPNRFTPFMSRAEGNVKAVTIVTEKAPPPADGVYPYLYEPLNHDVNFGVDQYHPLLLIHNADPEIAPIDNISVPAGCLVHFKVKATDTDGDELVYDIRDLGNNLIPGITFNGLTGEFEWKTNSSDAGKTLRLKAIASDGKYGRVEKQFRIAITP